MLIAGLGCFADVRPGDAAGLEFLQADHFLQQTEDIQQRELWLAAERIEIRGRMEESLFAAADTAELSGHFAKDVWVSAKDITLDGQIAQHARFAASGMILVRGDIGSSLMAASSGSIKIEEGAEIRNDALMAAPTVILDGTIHGHASVWARRAIVTGRINGDVRIRAQEISILPGTHIEGNLIYTAPQEIAFDRRIYVGGNVDRRLEAATSGQYGQHLKIQFFLYSGALLAGLLFTALFPRYTGHAVRRIRHSFWQTALTGSLAFFLIPLAATLALFTLVGIPAGILLGAVYVILLYVAKIVVALALGSVLLQRRGPQPYRATALTLAVGLLFLYFAAGLPIVGAIGTIAILFVGLGGLILGLSDVQYGQRPPPQRGVQGPPEIRTRDALSHEQ